MDIIPDDHRLESPTTPLLDDTDGSQDSPIFMYAPEFKFMPPPTYTEVRLVILPPLRLSHPFCEKLTWRGIAIRWEGFFLCLKLYGLVFFFPPRWIPASSTTTCSERVEEEKQLYLLDFFLPLLRRSFSETLSP